MSRFARWLLETFLPPDASEYVLGDLQQELGAGRGRLWLWREVVVALWKLHARPVPRGDFVDSVLSDLRIAARMLRRSPGFATVSVLTLGLAIGATTAIFSVVEPVLLSPLPYPNNDRLAFVWERTRDGSRDNVGFATFRDLVEQSRSIETAAAVGSWTPTLSDGSDPERVTGDRVSYTYFRTLGVQPAIGRDFLPDEDRPDHNQVVILGYGLWQRRFGGDSGVVDRQISVDGRPMAVVGVMPASFDNVVSPEAQIWRVLGYSLAQPWACRTCRHLRMVARFRAGVTPTAASAELDLIRARLERQYPTEYASAGTAIVPLKAEVTREFRPALLALAVAVVLVLLIAMANVTNLQLARAVRRRREFAIRTALGAARPRLLRQLITEGLLLAVLGGIAGLTVAAAAIPALVRHLPPQLPRLGAIRLDLAALAILAGVVLVLATIVGLAPARQRRSGLADELRSGTRLSGGAHHLARAGLVVSEVALAFMLLVSAALVARSLVRLLAVDVGFDASQLLTMEINSVGPRYREDEQVYAYHDRVREAVRAIPGVVSTGVANQLPLGGNVDMYSVHAPDRPLANPELAPSGDRYVVSADYLTTMRIPILRGRAFTRADVADTVNRVALVSAALAARLWPGEDPIGKRVRMGRPDSPDRTVIGVTGNVRHRALDANVTYQWYVPERQWQNGADNREVLVVRTQGDPASLAPAVRDAIRQIDPTQPIVRIATIDRVIATSTAQRRVALVLFGAFAIAALLLAVTGIYGVLAGSVAERTREIGVRSALGATPRNILGLVLGHGARLTAAGVAVGVAGSLALTRLLRALLFGIQPNDPITLAGVVALLGGVTLAACVVPAVRALRVDPSQAFRSE
jgi:putative ABC transport system permease protein